MKKQSPETVKFGNPYLSSFCMELSLLLDSGIPAEEGLEMLTADEKDKKVTAVLERAVEALRGGEPLSEALAATGAYSDYMLDMIRLGEETGRTPTVLASLSRYYDRKERLSRSVRSAVIYPSILAVLMFAVILIIIIKVLPVFNNVAEQLGVRLSGAAGVFTGIGIFLSENALWIVFVLLAALIIAGILIWRNFAGTKWGLSIAAARFSAAMSMGISSGLDIDRSMTLAKKLSDNPVMNSRAETCRNLMEEGMSFPAAAAQSGIFRTFYAKMLSVGAAAGALDTMMQEIADRCDDEVTDELEGVINRLEPILVIVMSLLVGLILLSVMLPLTQVMTAF